MTDKKSSQGDKNSKQENPPKDKDEHVKEAFEQAEKDIEKDPGLQTDNDEDLDEGELARKEGHP